MFAKIKRLFLLLFGFLNKIEQKIQDRSIHIHGDVHGSNFGTGDRNQQNINTHSNFSEQTSHNRQNLLFLLNSVEQFWIEGLLNNSLHQALWIELGKQLEQDKIYQPLVAHYQIPNQDPQPLPAEQKVSDLFIKYNRLLVILGEPGAGKTMTLVDLAKDLIAQARVDEVKPIL